MDRLVARSPSLRRFAAFSPLLLLVVLGIACWFAYLQLDLSRRAVGRSREARLAAEEIISNLKDAETAQRGFLLLGDPSYLAPYRQGLAELAADTARLRALASPSTTQQARLRELAVHIHERLAIIDSSIALLRAGNPAAAHDVVRSGHGRAHMEAIRQIVAQMDLEERDLLERQMAGERRSAVVLLLVFSLGLVFVIGLGLLVNRALTRHNRDREQWLKQLEAQNEQLQEQAEELQLQHDHLQEQAVDLEAQQTELEVQNEELQMINEALVAARIEAEQANAAKTAFLTSMSHELRTPLNAIAGYTDLIEAGVYGPVSPALLDAARRIHINEEHLLSIINQILEYTGLKSQTQPIAMRPVNAVEEIEQAEAVIAPMLRAKGLDYTLLRPDEPALVLAHPERLRQVLVNLFSNAIKFTPAPGTIVVSCAQAGEHVQIAVRDTGIGIAADHIERIFEPFVQLGSVIEGTSAGGVGLGLAISRELMHAMGGELSVVSEPNAGSIFTLTLRSAAAASDERDTAAQHSASALPVSS